jgi:hypothetical protein
MIVGVLVQIQALAIFDYVYIGVFVGLVGYAVGYSLLFKFTNIPERVLVGFHEAVLVTLFALYTFKPDIIDSYLIDFYAVCAVFLLEFIYELYKWVEFIKQSKASAEVVPADTKRGVQVNSFASDNTLDEIELNIKSQKRGGDASPLVSSDKKQSNFESQSPRRKR